MRQAAQPIQEVGVVEAAATIPAERIQPAGPDDVTGRIPRRRLAPPIETVAMPVERDLAGCTTFTRGAGAVQ